MILKDDWAVIYDRAVRDDGTLLFRERLTHEFLDKAKRDMGSYLYANQYQNETIPEGKQTFKKHWIRYYSELPNNVLTFAFIDPAISEADTSDYTGIVVVSVDIEQNWYVRYAERFKINPSELIEKCFAIYDRFKPQTIGIEDVAFQRAIVHFAHEEMKRRGKMIPVTGVKRGNDKSKQMRILALVPRFEWGTLFLSQGLNNLELELVKFPRASHDDILDSLASLEEIIYYPVASRSKNADPNPNDPGYESWYINKLVRERR